MSGGNTPNGPFTTIAHLLCEARGPAEGDDSLDLVIDEKKRDVRAELEQALATLKERGVPLFEVEHIGPSAIVKLRHVSHYQVCLAISALSKTGDVTLRFPGREQP